MNKRGHVLNAALLAVGVGVILEPGLDRGTASAMAQVGIPIVLGALFPDIDTAFGTHRKTFHNFLTLGVFMTFPLVFANLQYVWLGIITHYVLDLMGTVRGMALLYPYPEEYDIPVGVSVDSHWAEVATLAVTGVELAVLYVIIRVDLPATRAVAVASGLAP